MHYKVRNDLSYCVVDGHAVFLDIGADQYFRLPDKVEQAFLAYVSGSDRSRATETILIERNILIPGQGMHREHPFGEVGTPLRSASEMPLCYGGSAALALPEVMVTTWRCWQRIATWPLSNVFNEAVRYRARYCGPLASSGRRGEEGLLRSVGVFQRARLYVPIETRCLLDSISLFRFLARRHFHSRLVLGVTNDPFSAHCWVQARDIVLNDTIGNAMTHTIIKVI